MAATAVSTLALGVAAVPSTFAAAKTTTTITMWTLQLNTFAPYIKSVISQFEKSHPGVHVNWVDVPGTEINQKFLAALAAGQAPDLVNLDYGAFTSMQADFATLNGSLTAQQKKAFPSAAISPLEVNGKILAIPFYDAGVAYPIIYNMALLKKAGITKLPTTQAELFADGIKLHKAEPNVYWTVGGVGNTSTGGDGQAALLAAGVPILTNDLKHAAFDTPKGIKVVEQYKNAWQNGVYYPDSPNVTDPTSLFLQGAIAAYGNGITSTLTQSWGPIKKDLKVGPPILDYHHHYQVGPAFFWAVSKPSKHVKLAAQLAMQFMTVNNQLAFHKATHGGVGPVTNAAIKDKRFFQFPKNQQIEKQYAMLQADYMKYGVPATPTLKGAIFNYPQQAKIQQIIEKYWDEALMGQISPALALQNAAQEVNQALASGSGQ